jgi:hypothetical protein
MIDSWDRAGRTNLRKRLVSHLVKAVFCFQWRLA